MAEQKSSGGGIGLFGAVFIVFLVLKLTGTIDWSWWWVTSPLWIPVAVAMIVIIFLSAIAVWQTKKRGTRLQQRFNRFQQEREQLLRERNKQN